MSEVHLLVNGRRYGGWKSVQVTRSIEEAAGSFRLEATDRWVGQGDPWPIAEEDECRVEVAGEVVIDGYVDRRRPTISAGSRAVALSGRDRAAALVDSSAVLDKWTFRNASIADIARKVAEPFGIEVSVQSGLDLPKQRKLTINPGDSAFDAIERAAQSTGVLIVSDGAGGLRLTRAGRGRATPLVEGDNVLSAGADYDFTDRYHRYIVATQIAGTDESSGNATRVREEAVDEGVRRTERVLLIRPSSGVTAEYARRLADWEARVRAAQSEKVRVAVAGWTQPNGKLWPVNALVSVRIPSTGVRGELLISKAGYSLGPGGARTQITLVRPDAFTPKPRQAKVKTSRSSGGGGSGARWKELEGGV